MTPALDSKIFRRVLGQFATGVTVVAFRRNAEILGMTVNSFSSVSLDPPLILFCPGLSTRFAKDATLQEEFTVSILSESQRDVCFHFAGGAELETPPWRAFAEKVPVVEHCLSWLACRTVALHEHGDHLVVLGEVLEVGWESENDNPLLFFRGIFPNITP